MTTKPWKSPNLLRLPKGMKEQLAKDGLHERWVIDDPNNVEYLEEMGYEVIRGKMKKTSNSPEDGTNTDGVIRTREMILMRIKNETREEKILAPFRAKQQKTMERMKQLTDSQGRPIPTTGDIKITR